MRPLQAGDRVSGRRVLKQFFAELQDVRTFFFGAGSSRSRVGPRSLPELLRSCTSCAFNATNLLRQTRQWWIDLLADYDARIEMAYLEPPLPVILDQNKRRKRVVPEDVIVQLANKVEPPTWTEAHGLIVSDGEKSWKR